MAHTFKLFNTTSTGASIDFMDTNHGLVSYSPGYDPSGAPEITETAIIRLAATTSTGLNTVIQNLNRALQESQDKFERNYPTLNYLYLGLNGIDTGRSPLRRGAIVALADPMGTAWAEHSIDATVQFTRSNYWEATSLVELTITNPNSTGKTSAGTVVYNNCDYDGTVPTEHANWAKVTPIGDLPAPATIAMTPSTNASISSVYVTQFFQHTGESTTGWTAYGWYEGEEGGAGSTATSTGATYSNSAYGTKIISAGTVGENFEWTWSGVIRPDYNRVLMGAKFNGTIVVRPYFAINDIKTYGESNVLSSTGGVFDIFDLGIIYLPPKETQSLTYTTLEFGLNIIWSAGGTFNLDWVQTVPMKTICYAYPKEAYAQQVAPDNSELWINPEGDRYYSFVWDENGVLAKAAAQGVIYLDPNLVNWLFFKWRLGTVFKDYCSMYARVRVLYRPRWRFIHDS